MTDMAQVDLAVEQLREELCFASADAVRALAAELRQERELTQSLRADVVRVRQEAEQLRAEKASMAWELEVAAEAAHDWRKVAERAQAELAAVRQEREALKGELAGEREMREFAQRTITKQNEIERDLRHELMAAGDDSPSSGLMAASALKRLDQVHVELDKAETRLASLRSGPVGEWLQLVDSAATSNRWDQVAYDKAMSAAVVALREVLGDE